MSTHDQEQVTKGAAKDEVWRKAMFHRDIGDVVDRDSICEAIDDLPAEKLDSPSGIRSVTEIEQAISKLLNEAREYQNTNTSKFLKLIRAVDLVLWCLPFLEEKLGWKQLSWRDEDLLGEEDPDEKGSGD